MSYEEYIEIFPEPEVNTNAGYLEYLANMLLSASKYLSHIKSHNVDDIFQFEGKYCNDLEKIAENVETILDSLEKEEIKTSKKVLENC